MENTENTTEKEKIEVKASVPDAKEKAPITEEVKKDDADERVKDEKGSSRVRLVRTDRRDRERAEADKDYVEKLVTLNRTAKTVKGGRRMSFAALTVVGDKKGHVGYGFGKANDVSEAIKKSVEKAKRALIYIPMKNGTLPHEIIGKFKSSKVLLKPACSGTGIKAGGAVRAVMDAVGAKDIISKSLGSSASVNVVRATFDAMQSLMNASAIAKGRGKSINDLWG